MSLDVYLTESKQTVPAGSGIFVRANGRMVELTRAEWDEKFPGREPFIAPETSEPDCVYSRNITHNLNRMAEAAGIYKHLWRPDELGIFKAQSLIEPLRIGLALLKSDPERFMAFNPTNGWGDYGGLVEFVEEYLAACERYPDADLYVSR